MDELHMLEELSKAQKGEEPEELDVKHFEKMSDGDFITALHSFISDYLNRNPSDRKPIL